MTTSLYADLDELLGMVQAMLYAMAQPSWIRLREQLGYCAVCGENHLDHFHSSSGRIVSLDHVRLQELMLQLLSLLDREEFRQFCLMLGFSE